MMEDLTEEELRIMVDDDKLFDKYKLYDMYSVCQKDPEGKECSDCKLKYTGNEEKFYDYYGSYCRECHKKRSYEYALKHRERRRNYSRNYRAKRRLLPKHPSEYNMEILNK
jgi:hypothetical protein